MHTGLYKHFEEGERVHEIAYGYGMRTPRSPIKRWSKFTLTHRHARLRGPLPDDAGI